MKFSLITLLTQLVCLVVVCQGLYEEKLEVKPLPNQHVLTSFRFKLQSQDYDAWDGNITHYGLFPRTLPPILKETGTKELHLRFSQGWYDSEVWGQLPEKGFESGGTGVELWAVLASSSGPNLEKNWLRLTNSLSALFCASLNFVGKSSTTYPRNVFQPSGDFLVLEDENLYLLRSALPREPVCTENLTPFLKLIPTKGKSGISSLLDGHKVFDAEWNSMSIDIVTIYNQDGSYHYNLDLNIDLIMNVPKKLEINKSPIIKPIPGDDLKCDPTKRHDVYHCFPLINKSTLEIDLKELFGKEIQGDVPFSESSSQICSISDDRYWETQVLIRKNPEEQEAHAFYSKQDNKTCYLLDQPNPVNFVLKTEDCTKVVPVEQPPVTAARSVTGSGGLRTVFKNSGDRDTRIVYFESLPWFIRLYLSTLQIAGSRADDVHYKPSRDRLNPSHLEISMLIPANSTVTMSYKFDKSLLLMAEYPPDANHGFDLEPAVITVLENTKEIYQFRTTSLLVTLPTPDFSMPYNVIILSGTVMTLVFGAVFQLLIKRVVTVEQLESLLEPPPIQKAIIKIKTKLQAFKSRFKAKSD